MLELENMKFYVLEKLIPGAESNISEMFEASIKKVNLMNNSLLDKESVINRLNEDTVFANRQFEA